MNDSLISDPHSQCHIVRIQDNATPITPKTEPIHLHPVSPKDIPPYSSLPQLMASLTPAVEVHKLKSPPTPLIPQGPWSVRHKTVPLSHIHIQLSRTSSFFQPTATDVPARSYCLPTPVLPLCSFIHSTNKHLLSPPQVPGIQASDH